MALASFVESPSLGTMMPVAPSSTAVVAQIFAINDGPVGNAETYGDKLLLGNYCLTYANDAS